MSVFLKIALYIWQLPQNLLGLLFLLFLQPHKVVRKENYSTVRVSKRMSGGISLGSYVFLSLYSCDKISVEHELGHCKQSRMLGPFYLIVIGLPSLIHAWLNDAIGCCENHKEGYYHFYTEKWADKLAKINR